MKSREVLRFFLFCLAGAILGHLSTKAGYGPFSAFGFSFVVSLSLFIAGGIE